MKKKTAKKRPLTPVEREFKRRETIIRTNERRIARIREDADVEIGLLEHKNKNHREILAALKK